METPTQTIPKNRWRGGSFDIPGYYYDSGRKRYFKINGTLGRPNDAIRQSFAIPTKCLSSSTENAANIVRLSHLREYGQLQALQFPHQVKKCKFTSARQQRISIQTSLKLGGVMTCVSLMTDYRTNYIVGIWTLENHCGVTQEQVVGSYHMNQTNSDEKSIQFVPTGSSLPLLRGKVTDSCWVENSGSHHTILISNINGTVSKGVFVTLPGASRYTSYDTTQIYLGNDAVFACTFNKNTQRSAFGMEKCGLVSHMNGRETVKLYSEHDSVYCLRFHPNGQIGYSGTRKGNIYCWDLRDHPAKKYQLKIHASKLAVSHLDVLTDEHFVIGSSFGNQLQKLDLRSKKPLVYYKEHVNHHLKIPFSVEESMGLICSPGQDGCIRLWDISSGKLVKWITDSNESYNDAPKALFKTQWHANYIMPCIISGFTDNILVYTF